MLNTVVVYEDPSLMNLTLNLPAALAAKFSLTAGNIRSLRFGMKSVEAIIRVTDAVSAFPYTIQASSDTINQLGLILGERLPLYNKEDGTLVFGPLLGILGVCRNAESANQYNYFVNKANNNDGLTVVFDLTGVDSTRKKINGWYYSPGKGWISGVFPYPEVIYRQVVLNDAQRKKLYEMGVKAIFNEMFWLNKWHVHQALSKYPKIVEHLPLTHLVTTSTEVVNYLDTYQEVFVKPTLGFLGRGVVRIEKRDGCYVVCARINGTEQQTQYHSQTELIQYLGTIQLKYGYILQQAIPLARYDGELFDFRVMVQKGEDGQWCCSGALARVAQDGHVMTHISHGAVPVDVETAFTVSLGLSQEAAALTKKHMFDWCIDISGALENEYGLLGDLGFDIGVDRKGKLWYIECNANPDHTIFAKYDALMFSEIASMPRLFSEFLSKAQ